MCDDLDDPGQGVLVQQVACPICRVIVDETELSEHLDEQHGADS